MEEIRRLVGASGLPNFPYYSFPAVAFAPMQVIVPEPKLLSVVQRADVEAAAAPVLERSEAPLSPLYPLLAEVVEAVSDPKTTIPSMNSLAIGRNAVQALSRSPRRRPRPAGRAALAAIGQI